MERNLFEEKVRLDLKKFRADMDALKLRRNIVDLMRQSTLKSICYIAFEYLIIAFSVCLVVSWSYWFIPLAVILVGSRQRALVVLVHEGAHRNLSSIVLLNDVMTKLFCALPMLISLDSYRYIHGEHHRFLGDPEKDSDYLHDPDLVRKGWVKLYCSEFLSMESWLGNAFGYPVALRLASIGLLWWGVVVGLMFYFFGLETVVVFAILWILSRATVYHAIISFVIISDHVGLVPGGIMNFARNHPSTGFLRKMVHPHFNGLHLTHHLLPTVPYHNLKKVHEFLLVIPDYNNAEHCSTYFTGRHSVIRSWCRKISKRAES
ncbi:fatty acid desaturase [Ectopseudomonas chengduensis]|nr:fatty acid desaturase [Pseudomonas chengduensis]MDH1281557.1 fatty acid desaturase [Pseudomonas chengduensis]